MGANVLVIEKENAIDATNVVENIYIKYIWRDYFPYGRRDHGKVNNYFSNIIPSTSLVIAVAYVL